MEEKKFCRYCGEQIPKDNIICPKCGRQLKNIKEKNNIEINQRSEETVSSKKNAQSKFYEQIWFMVLMLIFFAPLGILFMWKFHPEIKDKSKAIITIIFTIWFAIIMISGLSEDEYETDVNNDYEINEKVKIDVVDFSAMERDSIKTWCDNNKVNCLITDEYSDSIAKGSFISQSKEANSVIYEGDNIKIIFSLGKKPSVEYINALKKAESYSELMHMSKKAIYNQLISEYGEQFSIDAAQYAIDNMSADWKTNALAKAKTYQESMHMSKNAIYDQLISEYGEKFTKEEAQYAIDHLED